MQQNMFLLTINQRQNATSLQTQIQYRMKLNWGLKYTVENEQNKKRVRKAISNHDNK